MKNLYLASLAMVGLGFALFFFITIGPPFFENPDVIAAFSAGFVNSYAAGFSTDTILCWLILAIWVIYEKFDKGIQHGWLAIALGAVPGVATGFALYLILRTRQIEV